MASRLITVAEMATFIKRAKAIGMSDDDRAECVIEIAAEPERGVSLGGGLRKRRYARAGGEKRGGYRIIYFFHDHDMPLFLLTIFAKNEKTDLSAGEKDQLIQICNEIRRNYGDGNE